MLLHPFYVYRATIVGVYDGDSCTALVDLGFEMKRTIKIRLARIDTPELRGDELEEGRKVRDIVREMILNKRVVIKTNIDKTGKYGRYIGEIYIGNINLNDWLLENGHAKIYGS